MPGESTITTNPKLQDNGRSSVNPVAEKLGNFLTLSPAEAAFLDSLAARKSRHYGAHQDIFREGDPARTMRIMLSGWGCRYKQLADGRRQITGYFLPGDICDLHLSILTSMDHSLASITPVTIVEIDDLEFEKAIEPYPSLKRAFEWESLVNISIQREWALNLGQRSALERIAHLLCELHARLESVGLANGGELYFPLTQTAIADATGISAVHVNRTMKELRTAGLIAIQGKAIIVPSMTRLRATAAFDPNYLHLGRIGDRS